MVAGLEFGRTWRVPRTSVAEGVVAESEYEDAGMFTQMLQIVRQEVTSPSITRPSRSVPPGPGTAILALWSEPNEGVACVQTDRLNQQRRSGTVAVTMKSLP